MAGSGSHVKLDTQYEQAAFSSAFSRLNSLVVKVAIFLPCGITGAFGEISTSGEL